jgi:hypothetical protein
MKLINKINNNNNNLILILHALLTQINMHTCAHLYIYAYSLIIYAYKRYKMLNNKIAFYMHYESNI